MAQGFSGVGLVSSHARTSGGGKGIGTFWGNCPKFELAPTPNAVERNSSMEVSRAPLRRMVQATSLQVTIVTDEFNKKNVARFVQGRIDEVAANTVDTINHTFPSGAAVGDILAVPHHNITDLVVTDSTGTPLTLALGTNYDVDAFSGHITLKDLTAGGPYVQPFKAAYKQGAVTVIAGLAVPAQEYWIAMSGINVDSGQRGHVDVYRVRLDPARLLAYINSEYNDFELVGSALVDTTKTAAQVGGQIFRWVLPSTHE